MTGFDLYSETLRLLREDRRSVRAISEECGINYHWLSKFRQGHFKDPGVRRVQRLYRFLNESVAA